MVIIIGLFLTFDGVGKTYRISRAFLARDGKQRAIENIRSQYPSSLIRYAGLVNIAWGEPGEWIIIFEVDQTRYRAWYSLDGATQTDLLTSSSLGPHLSGDEP